jgi:hypothetical protein
MLMEIFSMEIKNKLQLLNSKIHSQFK